MTADEKSFISEQFEHLHEKLDLKVNPVVQDVNELKNKCTEHGRDIGTLMLFKEGHQQTHAMEEKQQNGRRFMWEQIVGLIAGSGLIGYILTKWGHM